MPGPTEAIIIVIVFAFVLAPIVINVKLAKRKNRNALIWGILGWFFSFLSTAVLALLDPIVYGNHTQDGQPPFGN